MSATEKKKGRVTWDEEVIKEHDELRGTRQVIDEPPTPYEREVKAIDDEDDDVAAAASPGGRKDEEKDEEKEATGVLATALQRKLEDAAKAASEGSRAAVPSASKFSQEADFSEKRKQHYNEFEALKRWRETHADDDDDDE